jgi:predicted transposase YbfD/YdcC
LLAAFAPHADVVLAQFCVDAKTNEQKAARETIGLLPVSGKIVTADAVFTLPDFAERVTRSGEHYSLPANENQAKLRADIALAFETSQTLSAST